MLLIVVGIPALVNTGLTFHLISIFKENGLTNSSAALVLSLMAIVGFPISLVAGYVLDRVKVNYILVGIFIGEIIILILLQIINSIGMAILFGILWGFSNGFERIALNYVWPSYFGRMSLGSIKGSAVTIMVLGSALGPLPFGFAYDLFGGYQEILILTIIFPAIGILCSLLARKPDKIEESTLS